MQCMQCLQGSVTEDALWPYRRTPNAKPQVKQADSEETVQEQERLDTAVNSDQISNDTQRTK